MLERRSCIRGRAAVVSPAVETDGETRTRRNDVAETLRHGLPSRPFIRGSRPDPCGWASRLYDRSDRTGESGLNEAIGRDNRSVPAACSDCLEVTT